MGRSTMRVFSRTSSEWWCRRCGPVMSSSLINLAVHKQPEVRAAITRVGAHLSFLPPYSPDFNPIELAFAKLKAFCGPSDRVASITSPSSSQSRWPSSRRPNVRTMSDTAAIGSLYSYENCFSRHAIFASSNAIRRVPSASLLVTPTSRPTWLASQRQSPAVGTAQACRQSLHTRTPAILNALRRDIETFEQFQGPFFETSATNFFASVTFCRATAFARDCCIARRTRTHVRLQAIPASSWRHSNATSFDSRGSRLAAKRTDTRTYGTSRSSPAGTPTRTPAAARGYQSGFDRRCRGRD